MKENKEDIFAKLYRSLSRDLRSKKMKTTKNEYDAVMYLLEEMTFNNKPIYDDFKSISIGLDMDIANCRKIFKSLLKKNIIKKLDGGFVFHHRYRKNKEVKLTFLDSEKGETHLSEKVETHLFNKNDEIVEEKKGETHLSEEVKLTFSTSLYKELDLNTRLNTSSKAYKDNIFLKNGLNLDSKENTEIANVTEIAIQQTGVVTGRIKPSYKDPIQELCEHNAKYRNESFRPENLGAFKKCVDLIISVWDASRRGSDLKVKKAFAESVTEDCYSLDLIERFEQAFYAYSKDEFQKQVKAMSLEKWASQWDNWTEVYIERTSNNEIKKIDPGSYWILIREKLKG